MNFINQHKNNIHYLENKNKDELIKLVTQMLSAGQLVILSTDTVYGISGDYFNHKARQRISQIKKRPLDKGFIVLLPDKDSLISFADQEIPQSILKHIPASLTLIVKNKHQNLYGEKTIAIRVPQNFWISELLRKSKIPLISTSANLTGKKIAETENEIITQFAKEVDLIVLEKDLPIGSPSTILDITSKPYRIMRQGDYVIQDDLLH